MSHEANSFARDGVGSNRSGYDGFIEFLFNLHGGSAMPTFILMTRLTPETLHDASGRRATGKEWLKKVKERCPEVKWISHYAILGPYDFMDIYEAPDVETAHRVSLISRAEGAVSAESWQALSYDAFLKVLGEVA
jgi:uncharacterized protein with GYD domain